MEAVKELDPVIVESYVEVFQPPVKAKPRTQSEPSHPEKGEESRAAIGIFHAILFAIPLWALIIYGLIKLFG